MWSDGRRYEGEFFEDDKEGDGVLIFPDGTKYIGTWKKDKEHGEGTMIPSNSDYSTKGVWSDGKNVK